MRRQRMKKKQHTPSAMRMITKPRIGRAMTTPRFTLEEMAVGVVSDMLEGRRTSVKILVGETAKVAPMAVGKWQLYRMDSRTRGEKCKWWNTFVSAEIASEEVIRTVCEVHLSAGRARVHRVGGQVIAELAGVDHVVGECGAGAPIAQVGCTWDGKVGFNRCLDARTCYRTLRGLVGDY